MRPRNSSRIPSLINIRNVKISRIPRMIFRAYSFVKKFWKAWAVTRVLGLGLRLKGQG